MFWFVPLGVRLPQFGNHCITLYSITFPFTIIWIVRPDIALAACNFCQCHMLLVTVYHSVLCFSGKPCAVRCLWNSTCSWRAAKSEYYCWCVQTLFVFRCVPSDGSGLAHTRHCEIQDLSFYNPTTGCVYFRRQTSLCLATRPSTVRLQRLHRADIVTWVVEL